MAQNIYDISIFDDARATIAQYSYARAHYLFVAEVVADTPKASITVAGSSHCRLQLAASYA